MKGEMSTTRKNFIYQFVVLTILSVVTLINAEVDCNERPPFVHPKECCQIPDIIREDLKETCKEFIRGPPPGDMNDENETAEPSRVNRRGPPHHGGPHNHCLFSCVVNETGILIDEEIQKETLESYLFDTINDPELVEVLGSNFINCFEKFKQARENWENNPPPFRRGPCMHGGMLLKCALMKTFKECPESVWSNTDECNAVRDYFTECKPRRPEDGKNEEEI